MNRATFLRAAVLAASFTIPFSLFVATLAPTVTLEDSGELIAAARTLGVPHAPGYPLFTMCGKLFTLIPAGNVAYRLNLMSAFFSAVAAMLLAWTALVILEPRGSAGQGHGDPLVGSAALATALWTATAFEVWEQSVITEVYAINLAVVTAFLLTLARRWRDPSSNRALGVACFLLGLALTTHSTSLILLPLLGLHLVRNERSSLDLRAGLRCAAAFLAGLSPYLYLPLASARNPAIDWGNPESAAGLFRTVFVRHRRLGSWPSPDELLARLSAFVNLLFAQWAPVCLTLALVGLIALFRTRRNAFWHLLLLLALSGPLVTLGTDIDVSAADALVRRENTAQASVFYIPCYAALALLMGTGGYAIARLAARRPATRRVAAIAVAILPLALAGPNYRNVDMSDYRLAEDYADNLFGAAAPDSLILADWDPFYFPLLYYQIVENRRPDLTVLDQHLLRRSWYLEQGLARHPLLGAVARDEVEHFLRVVGPFEAGRRHDPEQIQRRYEAMLRALVTGAHRTGVAVYFAYQPPRSLVAGYSLRSAGAAWKLEDPGAARASGELPALRLRGLLEGEPVHDRWASVLGNYYGTLAYGLAASNEAALEFERSLEQYRRADRLLDSHHRRSLDVRRQIARLERQLGR